jgi:hypothetical protein
MNAVSTAIFDGGQVICQKHDQLIFGGGRAIRRKHK